MLNPALDRATKLTSGMLVILELAKDAVLLSILKVRRKWFPDSSLLFIAVNLLNWHFRNVSSLYQASYKTNLSYCSL